MKKKLLRGMIYGIVAIIVLIVAAIFSVDTIARKVVERRLRAATGMETSIEKMTLGFASSSIHIKNLVLKNPTEFGGDTFLDMPELQIEYDRDALRAWKLHLRFVRLNLQKVHVVENREGKSNLDSMKKPSKPDRSPSQTIPQTNNPLPEFGFDGIDRLDVSIGTIEFTSSKNPENNLVQNFAVTNEIFNNLKTELDFQTAGVVLILKAGLSGALDFDSFFKAGSKVGKKSKKKMPKTPEPLVMETTNSQISR
ncbi:MAG: hypothetical protein ABIP71_00090 [Verrucomicrobiota bacterium]